MIAQAELWTKASCPFCVKAKTLLDSNKIAYTEKEIGRGYSKEQLLAVVPEAHTLPQIFLKGEYVGGYTQLKEILGG
jgi:glutaredoxin 3